MRLVVVCLCVGVAGVCLGERPPEALEAEQRAQALELGYLVRKTDSLSSQLVERRGHLRQRLRAMYKMSQGGYLRLLLGSESPADLFSRRDAARRILGRDINELEAVRSELLELGGLRERLREGEHRAGWLALSARESVPTGLSRKDALIRPVPHSDIRSAILRPFGAYHEHRADRDGSHEGIEYGSDGVLIATRPGDKVYAPAAGAVRHVGEVPGLGTTVVIDHGEGWVSLVGHLSTATVRIGARVPQGFVVGEAAGEGVEFQLSQGGAMLDPTPWLEGAPR